MKRKPKPESPRLRLLRQIGSVYRRRGKPLPRVIRESELYEATRKC